MKQGHQTTKPGRARFFACVLAIAIFSFSAAPGLFDLPDQIEAGEARHSSLLSPASLPGSVALHLEQQTAKLNKAHRRQTYPAVAQPGSLPSLLELANRILRADRRDQYYFSISVSHPATRAPPRLPV